MIKEKTSQAIKGFSIKDTNKTGPNNYYVYVWDKSVYNKKTRHYRGWKSLGNMNNAGVWEKVIEHLEDVYGDIDVTQVQQEANNQIAEMERKRLAELEELTDEIVERCEARNEDFKLPNTVKEAEGMLFGEYMNDIEAIYEKHAIFDPMPNTFFQAKKKIKELSEKGLM